MNLFTVFLFPRLGCVNTYHFVYTHFVWSPMQQTIAFLSPVYYYCYYVKVVLTFIVILLVMIQSNSAFDIIPPFSNPMWFKIFHDYLVEYETGVSWVDSDWFGGDRIWEPVLYIIPNKDSNVNSCCKWLIFYYRNLVNCISMYFVYPYPCFKYSL